MKSRLSLCAVLSLAALGSARPASAEFIYGIATQGGAQAIVGFNSASPSNLQVSKILNSFNSPLGFAIMGIDYRPANALIYGLTSYGGLVTIDPFNGNVNPVSNSPNNNLNGFSFGFDFNPQIDRLRVVSEANANYVFNPNTGAIQTTGTNLFYGPADPNFGVDPNVVDSAYDQNTVGTLATQLYGIDTGLNILVKQDNNNGTLTTVGALTVGGLPLDVVAAGGFDISGTTGIAYAALLPANSSQSSLYSINLLTGALTNLGVIDGGIVITGLTSVPVPEPATAGLLMSGLLAMVAVRRRS